MPASRSTSLGAALLLALLVALLLPSPSAAGRGLPRRKSGPTSASLSWRNIRDECDRSPLCLPLPAHSEENCVLACQAPSCYKAVYAQDPLEPGQVDQR
jgi:hypothetical protein